MIALLMMSALLTGPAPALQKSIRAHLDTELLDGQSARWKWPKQLSPTMYCGWVNAKNRMGAYTGWAPYAALIEKGKASTVRLLVEPGVVNEVFSKGCTKAGYDITSPPAE